MPNVAGTLFAHWLNQQQAQRAQAREDERYLSEQAERQARVRAVEGDQRRKERESLAREAGSQAEALGAPTPQVTGDPRMQLAANLGAGEQQVAQEAIQRKSVLDELAASRRANAAQKLERLRQIGLVDRQALGHEQALEIQRMRDANDLQVARIRGKGGVTVNMPGAGVGLTTAVTSDEQKRILAADRRLAQLDAIDRSAQAAGGYDAASSFGQRGKTAISGVVGRAFPSAVGPGTRQLVARQATFDADLANFSNDILHDLSGAAINPSEWERLKRSVPNEGDSGTQKQAKVEAWRRNLKVMREQGIDAIVNGIRSGKTLEEVGLTTSDSQGAAAAKPADADLDKMAAELEAQGRQPEEIIEIFRSQGLIE